jgi:hypothetical protein
MNKWAVYDTFSGQLDFFDSEEEAREDYNEALMSIIEEDGILETAYIFKVVTKQTIE